ncbi:MAG: hypothetical protein IJP23_03855 [Oscillospiraceae bacterium]|nr:hypothetical protein [Oscillospiraceae bacterium]
MGKNSKPLGQAEVASALKSLEQYKKARASLQARVTEDENWWDMRCGGQNPRGGRENWQSVSAWVFNAVSNKHADAMDNYPEPVVLPREEGDVADAQVLSAVLPVIMERCDFEQVYSDNWWYKLKHGFCAYGVFWDSGLENGLGDIAIKRVDPLSVYWQPGVSRLEDSREIFVADLAGTEDIGAVYSINRAVLEKGSDTDGLFRNDPAVTGKCVVIDWYYKKLTSTGKTVLHYCKIAADRILFSTENEAGFENGLYDHGRFPIVFDVLYPQERSPAGFGLISIVKDPQEYIDRLCGSMLEMACKASAPRFWIKKGCGVSKEQFLNWDEPLVEVEGNIDDERLRPVTMNPMDQQWSTLLNLKIDELKETSSNRDFNSGGTTSGVTAAAAISALQEAGNKNSRDMIASSYRVYAQILSLCIELIRQFYDEEREFRITGEKRFVRLGGGAIRERLSGVNSAGEALYRRPVFDISVKPRKQDAFSKLTLNELAKELFQLGAFDPENAAAAGVMLEMMEFDGKEQIAAILEKAATK